MSSVARGGVTAAHRVRVLRALGLVAWRRRIPAAAPGAEPAGEAACLVVLSPGASPRALDLLGRALSAGGPLLARAGRVTLAAGAAARVPAARAYLVFGAAAAAALRSALSRESLAAARIVVVDELATVHASAAAKRALWRALAELRRAAAPAVR